MPVNLDKPQRWKADIQQSVDLYNDWFMHFAPKTYRDTRALTTSAVEAALNRTGNLSRITPDILIQDPGILPMLRMTTAPPLARDRLVGLAGVSRNLVGAMEHAQRPRVPPTMPVEQLREHLTRIGRIIERLADRDLFPWLAEGRVPTETERYRAATIVADRLCGAQADPIIRNAQESQMLEKMAAWLTARGYRAAPAGTRFGTMEAGMFAFRQNTEGRLEDGAIRHIPIDVVIASGKLHLARCRC